jgi:hypothetical protein
MKGGWHARVWRRFRICPGVTLNLSNSGLSASFGVKGLHHTISRRGSRDTISLPGSGLRVTRYTPRRQHVVEPHPGATLFWIVILVIIFAWLLGSVR